MQSFQRPLQHLCATPCYIRGVLVLFLISLLASCVAKPLPTPLQPGRGWPAEIAGGVVYYHPQPMRSIQTAHEALADIAPALKVAGRSESHINLRFATERTLVAELGWNEWEERERTYWWENHCLGICDDPEPIPYRVKVRRNATIVAGLDKVENIRLERLGDAREYLVTLVHEGGRQLSINTLDQRTQSLLADALYTIARSHGYNHPKQEWITFQDMNPTQLRDIREDQGVLILSSALDGPASNAGLGYPDVILLVDGVPATAQHLRDALANSRQTGRPLRLTALHWGRYTDAPKLRKKTFETTISTPKD